MLDGFKNKSDDTKKKVAVCIAATISVLILVVWVRFTIDEAKSAVAETGEEGFALWNKLEENVASAYTTLSDRIGKVKEQVVEVKERVGEAKVTDIKEE